MKITSVKSISDTLHQYDYLINEDGPDNYIEVTEWQNGEGVNISMAEKPVISLSFGQLRAIEHLINSLDYNK